jgi:hypothetical protein
MFSGLFRLALSRNDLKLIGSFKIIDKMINSIADKSEKEINNQVVDALQSYKQSLGQVSFKGRYFEALISTEMAKSHGHICQMNLPGDQKKRTELGDIIFAVDYVLIDDIQQTTKIINGCASVLQTKKEAYARQGLDSAQLYLMTQWPKIDYLGVPWKFDIFSDCFAFYFFVLDSASSENKKSSIISAPMLTKYVNVDKDSLFAGINQRVSLNINLLNKEKIGLSNLMMPYSFSSYLMRAFYLTIGSPSIKVREFLKYNFFPDMEEVEDCELISPTSQTQITSNGGWNDSNVTFDDSGDGEINAVRVKIILKRVEK